MIVYLKNNEIDRELWDNCIKGSPGVRPYGYSWYLDNMAPGWQALVDDDYDSVFPIPGFRKFGIQYIATPAFLQQLGAFSPDKPIQTAVNEFIEYLPEFYRFTDLCIGQRIDSDKFRVSLRANYQLDLSIPYNKLWEGFSKHCRRNIEKSAKHNKEIVTDVKPEELIELFINNKGQEIKGIKPRDYQRLRNLMYYCLRNKKGRMSGIRASRGKLIFGIFLVEIKGSKTMLFVVNSPQSREKRTGYFVVNELIKEFAGTRTMLDFAGSSVPSIASFMESFGSTNVPFYRIYRNRLLWPLRILK